MPLKIGVLGAARIAPAALMRPARQTDGVAVAAIAARDRQRAQAFAGKWGVPTVHGSYADLIADPQLDAVYIPLPNGLHAQWMLAAIEAGKHVLCEKPFTSNAAQAREVAASLEGTAKGTAKGTVVMEAFHYRYHPLARRMADIVHSGQLGEIERVETWMCFPLPRFNDIRYNFALAGGALMDAGCYAVHCLRLLTPGGEPAVTGAKALPLGRDPRVDRAMTADFALPGGGTGRIHTSMWSSTLLRIRAAVRGTRGTLAVTNFAAPQFPSRFTLTIDGKGGRERFDSTPTYVHQLRAFKRAVDGDTAANLTPPADSVPPWGSSTTSTPRRACPCDERVLAGDEPQVGGQAAGVVEDVEGDRRRLPQIGGGAPVQGAIDLPGQQQGGLDARGDQQRPPGKRRGRAGVRVSTQDGRDLGMPGEHGLEPVGAGQADRVDQRLVQPGRRMVQGHEDRPVPQTVQSGLQPGQRAVGQAPVVAAGDHRITRHDREPAQVVRLIQGPFIRCVPVVVARAGDHREPVRDEQFGRLRPLRGQAVVGQVAGHQDRVDVAGQAVEVVHHLGGAGGAAPAAVQVRVAQVGEHDHLASTVGSCSTGKFTELAMKHFSCAWACNSYPRETMDGSATVIRGRRTTRTNLSSSIRPYAVS